MASGKRAPIRINGRRAYCAHDVAARLLPPDGKPASARAGRASVLGRSFGVRPDIVRPRSLSGDTCACYRLWSREAYLRLVAEVTERRATKGERIAAKIRLPAAELDRCRDIARRTDLAVREQAALAGMSYQLWLQRRRMVGAARPRLNGQALLAQRRLADGGTVLVARQRGKRGRIVELCESCLRAIGVLHVGERVLVRSRNGVLIVEPA